MVALMTRRLARLPCAVAESQGYRVLDGVEETLRALSEQGCLLGLTTGGVEAAARIKPRAPASTTTSASAATAPTRPIAQS
jgi:hypothetical protein